MNKKSFYDRAGRGLTMLCAAFVILLTMSIIYYIGSKGLSTFINHGVSLREFLFSDQWRPDRPPGEGGPQVGSLAFIIGSIAVSLLSVGISAPLGVIVAVFIVEIAPGWGQRILQPAVELLAGIPSVVYGYIGLSLLVPLIRSVFGGGGFSLMAGFLVLSVMILPTIISVSTDTLRALPVEWKHASYALGATRWQTIRMAMIPAARSGLITAVVLGMARAFGEALAVQMVIGNTRAIPTSILSPIMTLTSAITMDMGATIQGTTWNNALWSMGLLLLLMSLFFILIIRFVVRRGAV
ncbi:phosphate ABC transporter membrane protein 1, PhoT family [Desulfotomaculum arcticum]|uniref:Phosphate transport system permease protein n=1 Tax=Desulfotruncus arcticus DSM 17038 TaxID=1121424 RepID=A0A1I2V4Y1_9FIRM|nr:phosphate ABC transporter permease subunit PstC [Desulfotruncus arcticus]SFG82171.1 phosphate ABC transporter membrane protein 1, PhoT family [Desulfotomaculum arcticum] [Desulfotruncus arcticus DSM 17038]